MSIQMPLHTHSLLTMTVRQAASTASTSGIDNPTNAYPASGSMVFSNSTDGNNMGSYSSIGSTPIAGSSQPISILQPYLAMNFIIAVEGIFPSRN